MLFDLRGRGRRNVIKVVYITLALLMGGGLVFFGIGGNTSGGGLLDAVVENDGGDVGAAQYEKEIKAARAAIAKNAKDEAAYGELIRAQVQLAATGDQFDPNTGEYTEAGKADLREAIVSWKAFQAINPQNDEEEARVASRIVQAFGALQDLEGLVSAQEIVALNRNSSGQYAALANFAYAAGQIRKGDLAAKKAIELEDPDQRSSLKQELDSYKAQAAPAVTPQPITTVTPGPTGKKGNKKSKSKE